MTELEDLNSLRATCEKPLELKTKKYLRISSQRNTFQWSVTELEDLKSFELLVKHFLKQKYLRVCLRTMHFIIEFTFWLFSCLCVEKWKQWSWRRWNKFTTDGPCRTPRYPQWTLWRQMLRRMPNTVARWRFQRWGTARWVLKEHDHNCHHFLDLKNHSLAQLCLVLELIFKTFAVWRSLGFLMGTADHDSSIEIWSYIPTIFAENASSTAFFSDFSSGKKNNHSIEQLCWEGFILQSRIQNWRIAARLNHVKKLND